MDIFSLSCRRSFWELSKHLNIWSTRSWCIWEFEITGINLFFGKKMLHFDLIIRNYLSEWPIIFVLHLISWTIQFLLAVNFHYAYLNKCNTYKLPRNGFNTNKLISSNYIVCSFYFFDELKFIFMHWHPKICLATQNVLNT